MAATEAINQATDDLIQLTESVPNVRTKQEVDALLNEISQRIEESIENIGRAAQGQQPRNNGGVQGRPNRIPDDSVINLIDTSTRQPVDINFGNLLQMITRKSRQTNSPNKYTTALDQLKRSTSPQDVPDILNRNNIEIKNNQVFGGRKTKKISKQKGGFTYKNNSRRRSITARSNSKRSSRNSRRSSR